MYRSDDDEYDEIDEEYPEFVMWLLEFIVEESTHAMPLDAEFLPPCFQDVVLKEWETPLVMERDIPIQSVDWTAKASLENSKLINWWLSITNCTLYPLNGNDVDKFDIISKPNINSKLRFITEKIKILKDKDHQEELNRNCMFRHMLQRLHYKKNNFENALLTNPQEISVLVLANIICQPIVLFSKSTISRQLGGIYLPTRSIADGSYRKPLLMAYDSGCFIPMMAVTNRSSMPGQCNLNEYAIPFASHDFQNLPVKRFGKFKGLSDGNILDVRIWNVKDGKQNHPIKMAFLGKQHASTINIGPPTSCPKATETGCDPLLTDEFSENNLNRQITFQKPLKNVTEQNSCLPLQELQAYK